MFGIGLYLMCNGTEQNRTKKRQKTDMGAGDIDHLVKMPAF